MAIIQQRPVAPPVETDKPDIVEFASVIQSNLEDLYLVSHRHTILTEPPAANDGVAGDIKLVENTTVVPSTFHLYCKFNSGWKAVTLS